MLIDELKKGSQQAFHSLVEQYSKAVIRTCYSFVQNAEDAEDITQDVFIEVYRSIRSFRADADLKTWLYRIAINKSLDYLRKQKRKKRLADLRGLIWLKKVRNSTETSPHQQLEKAEQKAILQHHIALLPENQRIAIVLSQYDKLSNKQIAEIMDTSVSAVESLLHRARANLHKHLKKYFENST